MHLSNSDSSAARRRPVAYALGAVFLWSTVATAFKLTLGAVSPVQLVFGASAVATVFFSGSLLIRGRFRHKNAPIVPRSSADWIRSAVSGLLNPFLYYLVLLTAYSRLLGQEALALNYVWPMVLVVMSIPLLKARLGIRSGAALIISFVGVLVIASRGSIRSMSLSDPLGVALALGSSIIWSGYWLLNMKDRRDDTAKLCLGFCFGTAYSLIALVVTRSFSIPTVGGVMGAAYVGLFEMGITFSLWLRALKLSPSPALVSNFVYISPFLSLVLLRFVLGESLLVSTFVGLVFIIGGIGLQQISSTKPG